jgi:hypothetical protein
MPPWRIVQAKLTGRRTQRHYSHDGTVGSKGSLGGQVGEENAALAATLDGTQAVKQF